MKMTEFNKSIIAKEAEIEAETRRQQHPAGLTKEQALEKFQALQGKDKDPEVKHSMTLIQPEIAQHLS